MKKQIKKLNLNKKTISNLGTSELTKIIGGGTGPTRKGLGCTGNTCHGHTCGNGNACFCG